jgi:1,4-alpha-glucan branching enzyme
MPASLAPIDANTPLGANMVAGGATFRVWAPNALAVHVAGDFNGRRLDDASLLTRDEQGRWAGFIPEVHDRDRYLFHVIGLGSTGFKRDPHARELDTPFPCDCIVRSPAFAWHDGAWVTPRFEDFVIYQLHVGAFYAPGLQGPAQRGGTFLDVARKLPHLAALGVTALQLLPIQEFQTRFSLGYNGTDHYSPEMNFAVPDADLAPYLDAMNTLLDVANQRAGQGAGQPRWTAADLRGEMNQLKALIDLCHVHGIAVLLDVVYNHAGGDFGDQSLYFLDRQPTAGGNASSLYFSERGHAGGLVFDYAKPEVRDFLIDNARFFLDEYHVDGFRYDQVSVIDHDGAPHGWAFCQQLTAALHAHRPSALNLAEYWSVNPWVVKPAPDGAGFDTSLTDGLRIAVRDVIEQASHPDERPLPMTRLAESLWPAGFDASWRFVQGPENHDIVYAGREMRIARLGQPDDPRSWYARSRARVASGIGLTAPGIPMLFMGQEFLEDKPWSDDLSFHPELLLHWAGLDTGDKQMLDHLRFMRELIALRRREPALRGEGFRVVHVHDGNRVLAFHRWVDDGHGSEGRDVLVVAHLGNAHRHGYRIGLPFGGMWREAFNSDVYEQLVNPQVAGNGGAVWAEPQALHGFDYSAALVLPANSVLVFVR